MTLLVTQDEALRQLRLSAASITADELLDVMFKAEQASDIVTDYLKTPDSLGALPVVVHYTTAPAKQPTEPWTENTVPILVKGVILVVLVGLYDGRTPGDELLSPQLCDVLARYRDPALA